MSGRQFSCFGAKLGLILAALNPGKFKTDTKVIGTPMNVGNAVFQATGITKVYHMGEVDVHALRGVDLELAESEFVVLLGPSGSGKSTLLNILGGLDVPSRGQVYYRDRNLTVAGENALTEYRRHHIGFVFQFYTSYQA